MEGIVSASGREEFTCADVAADRPLVLLALGQSNAGNHGSPASVKRMVTVVADGRCFRSVAPLPGGTGTGGSIWERLPESLAAGGYRRPVVISVLAVDASHIGDWVDEGSPLRQRLAAHVKSMLAAGLPPQFVLWQQGEADARAGRAAESYASSLDRLAILLGEAGVDAPILLARSTVCRSAPNAAIRSAIDGLIAKDGRFRSGPDTDQLSGEEYRDGCHLTVAGLDGVAGLWAEAIGHLVASGSAKQE